MPASGPPCPSSLFLASSFQRVASVQAPMPPMWATLSPWPILSKLCRTGILGQSFRFRGGAPALGIMALERASPPPNEHEPEHPLQIHANLRQSR